MIDIVSYRASIGRWSSALSVLAPRQPTRSNMKERPRFNVKGPLRCSIILLIYLILSTHLSAQVLAKLLEIGGVEMNPGPPRRRDKTSDDRPLFICDICKSKFTRRANMMTHKRNRHVNNMNIKCRLCG